MNFGPCIRLEMVPLIPKLRLAIHEDEQVNDTRAFPLRLQKLICENGHDLIGRVSHLRRGIMQTLIVT